MRKVSRQALVPFSDEQMYALVADVESYPEFLPWCTGAVVHLREGEIVEASIEMEKAGLRKSFRTRNRLIPNKSISLRLVDGPFRSLTGEWQITGLGEDGCRVSLEVEFEFESRLMDKLLGPFFEDICNRLVNAFTERAASVYR